MESLPQSRSRWHVSQTRMQYRPRSLRCFLRWSSCRISSPKHAAGKEIGVEEKAFVPIELRTDAASRKIIEENRDIVERLAKVSEIKFADSLSAGLAKHSIRTFDVAVVYQRTIDVAAERERLTKDIARLEKVVAER